MDFESGLGRLREFGRKNRFVFLVLLLGIGLMLLPDREAAQPVQTLSVQASEESLEQRLSELLSRMEGAGKVQVLLTVSDGEEILYQSNENTTHSELSDACNSTTVTLTDASRNQAGLIRQVNPPTYQGAVILCRGADNSRVALSLVQAVSNATGLPTHKITVLKMK